MTFEPNTAAGAQRQAATRNFDRPEVAETFADLITSLVFVGQSLRIEFGLTRLDEVKPNMPITGRRYTACRLALPPAAAALISSIGFSRSARRLPRQG